MCDVAPIPVPPNGRLSDRGVAALFAYLEATTAIESVRVETYAAFESTTESACCLSGAYGLLRRGTARRVLVCYRIDDAKCRDAIERSGSAYRLVRMREVTAHHGGDTVRRVSHDHHLRNATSRGRDLD